MAPAVSGFPNTSAVDNTSANNERPASAGVPLWQLYGLRILFALIAVAQGSMQLPLFFNHPHWTVMSGAAHSFLLALAILSFVGIRYPLQMLPVLLWELSWKVLWLVVVALPAWQAGPLDQAMLENLIEIAVVVIIPIAMPWGYVFNKYLKQPGDRWVGA